MTAQATISATSAELAICRACGHAVRGADAGALPDLRGRAPVRVRGGGQRWTTLAELRDGHGNWIKEDAGLVGIGTEPSFAIGQRALLVPWRGSNLMWECISLLDDETAEEVERRGGLAGIAISHPHYYSSLVECAQRFDCPVYLHADDAEWVMRPDERIVHWQGERHELGEGLTLVRCGGHFAGGQVLHCGTQNALLSGDIVQVIPTGSGSASCTATRT